MESKALFIDQFKKKKKKKKKRKKNQFGKKKKKNTQNLMFPHFLTLFFFFFNIFFHECKIYDFTNFLVPKFFKSDKNFVCNDFFIFLFLRYFEILKFGQDSAFFEILLKF